MTASGCQFCNDRSGAEREYVSGIERLNER